MVQEGYGLQNTVDEVFFTDADEAAIFVKASDGTSPLMANLTNSRQPHTERAILERSHCI